MPRDDIGVEAALGDGTGSVTVGPAELVRAEPVELGVSGLRHQAVPRRFAVGYRGNRCRGTGDVGGADTVAVGDGGQSLDVPAEQPREDLGLGLAQLGELLGHVRDRAVVLAELLAGTGLHGGGGIAVGGQRLGEHLRLLARGRQLQQRPVPHLHLGDPLPGELHDGLVATGLGDEAQSGRGQVVVGLVEGVPAGVGQHEDLGGAATAAGAVDPLLTASTRPSSSRWSRCRRTAAGVSSSRSASTAALDGPLVRIERATRSRVDSSRATAVPGGTRLTLRGSFHNISVA